MSTPTGLMDNSGFATPVRTLWKTLAGCVGVRRVEGSETYIDALSQRLYRSAISDGGWSVDAGILGPQHFRGDAERILAEISLGASDADAPTP